MEKHEGCPEIPVLSFFPFNDPSCTAIAPFGPYLARSRPILFLFVVLISIWESSFSITHRGVVSLYSEQYRIGIFS